MIGIDLANRNDDFTSLDIELATPESFVKPELLKGNLTTTLCLSLVFTTFISIDFYGILSSTMLELNFHSHGPTLSEIIAQIKGYVWQVETAMAIVILISGRVSVTVEMLAIEVAAHHGLSITTNGKSGFCCCTVCATLLCTCRCQTGNEGS